MTRQADGGNLAEFDDAIIKLIRELGDNLGRDPTPEELTAAAIERGLLTRDGCIASQAAVEDALLRMCDTYVACMLKARESLTDCLHSARRGVAKLLRVRADLERCNVDDRDCRREGVVLLAQTDQQLAKSRRWRNELAVKLAENARKIEELEETLR